MAKGGRLLRGTGQGGLLGSGRHYTPSSPTYCLFITLHPWMVNSGSHTRLSPHLFISVS